MPKKSNQVKSFEDVRTHLKELLTLVEARIEKTKRKVDDPSSPRKKPGRPPKAEKKIDVKSNDSAKVEKAYRKKVEKPSKVEKPAKELLAFREPILASQK